MPRRISSLLRNCLSGLCCIALLAGSGVSAETLPESLKAIVFPVSYPRLSSVYGKRKHPVTKVTRHHRGVDLAAPTGAMVLSVARGRIVFADNYAGYGKLIVIEHQPGVTTHYGHLSEIEVEIGVKVRAGETIGRVGSTGLSSGPHLHFEIRRDGKSLDPQKILPQISDKPQG